MNDVYAEVVVDISALDTNRRFTYRIPEELAGKILPGARVEIPFGRTERLTAGYVVGFRDTCALAPDRIKEIRRLLTGEDTVESRLVELAAWMASYYTCPFLRALKTVLPTKRAVRARAEQMPPAEETEPEMPPELTPAQETALGQIREAFSEGDRPVLLYGLTGSGKTLLYMELIDEVLRKGQQAIVLIPEIALTYQTVRRFGRRFGDSVRFLHSRLSEGEKYLLHKAARSGEIRIMVGPRSALFTPFPNLGLIIIDEEHEGTYRSESAPRYDAREAAGMRSRMEGAKLLLGSATPSIDSFYKAKTGVYRLVKLGERFGRHRREVFAADMREELAKGNRSIVSDILTQSLAECLDRGEQAMLFLNRRGYAGFVSCRSCGFVYRCPHCDVSLTEHTGGKLVCHYCGYTRRRDDACPQCGSRAIGGMKIGTQQVERMLSESFPGARVLRMDRDTTGGKEGHTKILKAFAEKKADILLGTQMIVKGHDFPSVSLIGILAADLSLNDSDYRSSELTFSLLTQAIGRAGRAEICGRAVVQTYHPEHYAVSCALAEDFDAFYEEETALRQLLRYPPCGEMLAVYATSKDPDALETGMAHIRGFISKLDPQDRLLTVGPAPMAVSKVRDRYRMAIYLRHPRHDTLREAAERIRRYTEANSGFAPLDIQFDYTV